MSGESSARLKQDQIRAAIGNAAASYAGPGGVVRMSNFSICIAAQK